MIVTSRDCLVGMVGLIVGVLFMGALFVAMGMSENKARIENEALANEVDQLKTEVKEAKADRVAREERERLATQDPQDMGQIQTKVQIIPVAPFKPFKLEVGAENPSVWVNMLSFEAFYEAHIGPSDGPFAKLRLANLLIAGHKAAALEAAKAKEANNPWGKVIGEPAERWLAAHAKEVGAATLDAWRESERLALATHADPQSNLCEGYGQVEQVDGWRATVHFQPAMGRPFIRVMVWREIPQNQ